MPAAETARFRLLVTVKAYPSISARHNELVCCAGITEEKKWVRLYPVPYRDLPHFDQFKKYDVIEVACRRPEAHKDNRPESWKPDLETLRLVGHLNSEHGQWTQRMTWIDPTILPGFAELAERQELHGTSLGAFRVKEILGCKLEPDAPAWNDAQLATIQQSDLFSDKEPLEKVPWRFRLGFLDERGKAHWLSIIDWEFFELWRGERTRLHGDGTAAAEQVRRKVETIACEANDLILYAGNLGHPAMRKSFMILGLCYPRASRQIGLF